MTFGVGSPTSFKNIQSRWWPVLKKYSPPGVPIILVGLNCHLRQDEKIIPELKTKGLQMNTYAEGELMMKKIGAVNYLECSAKTLEGIKTVFDGATRAAIEYQKRTYPELEKRYKPYMPKPESISWMDRFFRLVNWKDSRDTTKELNCVIHRHGFNFLRSKSC